MTDRTLYQYEQAAIEALLVGHKVVKVSDDTLVLDDGQRLKFVGNDGGCLCGAGCYDLTELNGVDNVITAVEFEFVDSPEDLWPDYQPDAAYRIFVFADNQKTNLATFTGSDGNGYYGTGYHIVVSPAGAE